MSGADRMKFATDEWSAIDLLALRKDALGPWLADQSDRVRTWVDAQGFTAAAGSTLTIPGETGLPQLALAGLGDSLDRRRKRFILAGAAASLPTGTYRLTGLTNQGDLDEAALGWLLASYRFERYKTGTKTPPRLLAPAGVDAARIEAIAAGEALTRDLINTPANDMGPDELEAATRKLADTYGATLEVTQGHDLIDRNFPLIHAVGRASPRAPRLLDLRWGADGPTLTLVGKGIAFDTGGLNLKPGGSMALMKKDMGGAAAVLGLARMIMALGTRMRLRVLIPVAENSVSGAAFRPGDILTARNGKTVEINNTDAEGRLVLADALAYAAEDPPDMLVSMATLTGAARVAVGPDLAPFYCDDNTVAGVLGMEGNRVHDPVWRMPFHDPYETLIEPAIADLDNAPSGGFAGSITAALFLRRFAGGGRYIHFDIYGWQPVAAPARPKGGVGQGTRALLAALPRLIDL